MAINFAKIQGNWNDFILVDEVQQECVSESWKAEFAAQVCPRREGIGADAVLYLSKSRRADLKMRCFLADRSEAELSGNGVPCVAKYAVDMGYIKDSCHIETPAGIIAVTCSCQALPDGTQTFVGRVTMPPPLFLRKDIPATGDDGNTKCRERIGDHDVVALRLGVPHAIVCVEDVTKIDVAQVGGKIRNHVLFPEGANVDFVQYISKNRLKIRTCARGMEEEAISCGTGAAASVAALHDMSAVDSEVVVETQGGPLTVQVNNDSSHSVTMLGTATTLYKGVIPFTQAKPKSSTPGK